MNNTKEAVVLENAEKLADLVYKISEARIRKGLTQRQLAELSGLKQSAIARFESLQVVPRLDTVIRIASCLGVDLDVKSEVFAEVIQFPLTVNTSSQYNWSVSFASANYAPAVACR